MPSTKPPRYAVIDIGSNATRLLLATYDGDKMIEEMFIRVPLRPMNNTFGKVSKSGEQNLIKVLHGLRLLIESQKTDIWQAVATAALRDSKNREALLKNIKRCAGVPIRILSGQEEAETIGRFVATQFSPDSVILNIDCGGGSTDCALMINGKVAAVETFMIGSARPDCGLAAEKERLCQWLKKNTPPRHILTGSGGSMRKLKEICGNINSRSLIQYKKHLSKLSVNQRALKYGFTPDRAVSVMPAIEIYLLVLSATKSECLEAVGGGLASAIMNDIRKQ